MPQMPKVNFLPFSPPLFHLRRKKDYFLLLGICIIIPESESGDISLIIYFLNPGFNSQGYEFVTVAGVHIV